MKLWLRLFSRIATLCSDVGTFTIYHPNKYNCTCHCRANMVHYLIVLSICHAWCIIGSAGMESSLRWRKCNENCLKTSSATTCLSGLVYWRSWVGGKLRFRKVNAVSGRILQNKTWERSTWLHLWPLYIVIQRSFIFHSFFNFYFLQKWYFSRMK